MFGFISVPSDFVSNVGGNATTIIDDLKIPATLIMGVFFAFWIFRIIKNWFFMNRLYRAGEKLGWTREEVAEKYEQAGITREQQEAEEELEEEGIIF